MIISSSTKKLPKCSYCGKKLILVEKIVTKDTFSKIVITNYKCSDIECQKAIDKKTKARKKLQKEQDAAKKARAKAKMRLNKKKILR